MTVYTVLSKDDSTGIFTITTENVGIIKVKRDDLKKAILAGDIVLDNYTLAADGSLRKKPESSTEQKQVISKLQQSLRDYNNRVQFLQNEVNNTKSNYDRLYRTYNLIKENTEAILKYVMAAGEYYLVDEHNNLMLISHETFKLLSRTKNLKMVNVGKEEEPVYPEPVIDFASKRLPSRNIDQALYNAMNENGIASDDIYEEIRNRYRLVLNEEYIIHPMKAFYDNSLDTMVYPVYRLGRDGKYYRICLISYNQIMYFAKIGYKFKTLDSMQLRLRFNQMNDKG